MALLRMTKGAQQIAIVAVVAALVGFVAVALFSQAPVRRAGGNGAAQPAQVANQGQPAPERAVTTPGATGDATGRAAQPGDDEDKGGGGRSIAGIFGADQGAIFGSREPWTVTVPRVLLRLLLAALLAALVAFRPRAKPALLQRSFYVAQTQILLAVVASALMMIVGDSAARAFGIFAAASLVRFRTNISDPKEITVLHVNLALGLAAGVGHWDVALVLALFMLPLLWLLERREDEQVYRAMALTVKTLDTEATRAALRPVLHQFGMTSEVRQLEPANSDEPIGTIVYYVNMSLNVSTDAVSEAVREADPANVQGVEWEQQKSRESSIFK
jgi:uncharacterized membrane protein YhiD involved in acid resistance